MTPDEIRAHATRIILSHARDVEWGSIGEMMEDHLGGYSDEQYTAVCHEVNDAIRAATVTVSWPDTTETVNEIEIDRLDHVDILTADPDDVYILRRNGLRFRRYDRNEHVPACDYRQPDGRRAVAGDNTRCLVFSTVTALLPDGAGVVDACARHLPMWLTTIRDGDT